MPRRAAALATSVPIEALGPVAFRGKGAAVEVYAVRRESTV